MFPFVWLFNRLSYTIFVINLGSFISGLILGTSSSAVQQLTLSQASLSLFSAIVNIGGFFGCLIGGQTLDIYGRKASLSISCIPAALGWILMYVARHIELGSSLIIYFCLIFGRFLTGFACGLYTTIVVPYLLEITHPDSKYKGLIASLNQVSIVFGIMFAYGLGNLIYWPSAMLIYLSITALMHLMLNFTTVPESPKWLFIKNRRSDAENSNMILHGNILTNNDSSNLNHAFMQNSFSISKIFFPCGSVPYAYFNQLLVSLTLIGLQQVTGINALMFFTETICISAGSSNPSLCAFYIAFAQFIFSFLAIFVIDKMPMKLILEITGCLMAGAQFCFALSLMNNASGSISLACLIVFFFGFSFGWGPLPFVLVMELFPPNLRGAVSAAGLGVNWLLSYIITQSFLGMSEAFGTVQVFIFYGVMCLLSSAFVAYFVTEPTKYNTFVQLKTKENFIPTRTNEYFLS